MVENKRNKEYPDPVAVQLISHLSEGAYTTFSKAVKELVINAFDADAEIVNLNFNDDLTQLIITDEGDGLSAEKFKSEFLRIAGSKRRIEKRERRFKERPIIGRFGIGFLSVARLCDKVTVYSKQKGQNFEIVREIPLKHFFDPERQLKNLKDEYFYYSLPDINAEETEKSYTKIVLDHLRDDIVQDLMSLEKSKGSWSTLENLSGLDRFKWELGVLLPVRYRRGFPVAGISNDVIARLKTEIAGFNFKVLVNGEEIVKPICLGYHYFKNSKWNYDKESCSPGKDYDLLPVESPLGSNVKFKGYIYNQSKQIEPGALRGILLRVNHVGIKGFSKSLFEYPKNIGPILSAISGEIFLSRDFEDVLTLDKDDLKEDHPLFKELIGYIYAKIDEVATASRARSARRRTGRPPLPKVKDLNLSSKEIRIAERIIGKRKFRKEYFPNLSVSIKTNVKNLVTIVQSLVGKTLDKDEADYLVESLNCFEADCRRGAILMAWNAGMFRIHRKIDRDIGYARLQSEIISMRTKSPKYIKDQLKDCGSMEELRRYSEKTLFLLIERLGLIKSSVASIFNKSLGVIRDNCAHPTGHKPTDGEAIFMIEAVLNNILKESAFKVSG